MKIQLRKAARKEARKSKKQKKHERFLKRQKVEEEIVEQGEEGDEFEEDEFEEEFEEEEQEEEVMDKPTELDLEIIKLEERLGLRGKKTKDKEKNWKKIKKQLELDGLGADFYDILEGTTQDPIDQISISPPSSPELDFVPNSEHEVEEDDEEQEEFSEESLPKKRKKRKRSISSDPSDKESKNPVKIFTQDGHKKIKGLLNRLSDQNIEPLTKQISELFKVCSNVALLENFWEFLLSIFENSTIPTQLLAVYATEISALSRLVGREISAYLLEKLHSSQESFTQNQVSFIAYLYYFGVISVEILKGFLSSYIDDLSESKLEFLITSFNIIGFTLRKKHPNTLKDLLSSTQQKFKLMENPSSRFKVLIEILSDIKNNKKKQNSAEERLKFLKNWLKNSVIKQSGIKESEISTNFAEISKGKWRELLTPAFEKKAQKTFSLEIEALAKEQKMNTESRKQIFCLIMTAEDYMDAYAKLSNLKKQERDIVRVVIICAGQESVYNKFYSLLAGQLCTSKNSYKYSFQYALWDNLKEFSEFSIRKISNTAKFFADLVVGGNIELSVMKAVNFDDLDEHLSIFLRIFLENVLVSAPIPTIGMIFERVGKNDKLAAFAEGLRVFIKLVVIQHPRKGVVKDIGMENFIQRAKVAKRSLKVDS